MDIVYNLDKKSRYCLEEDILFLSVSQLSKSNAADTIQNLEKLIVAYEQLNRVHKQALISVILTMYKFKETLKNFESARVKLNHIVLVFMQATTLGTSVEIHVAMDTDDFYLAGYYDCENAKIILTPKPGLLKVLFDPLSTHHPLKKDLHANRIRIVPNTAVLAYTTML